MYLLTEPEGKAAVHLHLVLCGWLQVPFYNSYTVELVDTGAWCQWGNLDNLYECTYFVFNTKLLGWSTSLPWGLIVLLEWKPCSLISGVLGKPRSHNSDHGTFFSCLEAVLCLIIESECLCWPTCSGWQSPISRWWIKCVQGPESFPSHRLTWPISTILALLGVLQAQSYRLSSLKGNCQ